MLCHLKRCTIEAKGTNPKEQDYIKCILQKNKAIKLDTEEWQEDFSSIWQFPIILNPTIRWPTNCQSLSYLFWTVGALPQTDVIPDHPAAIESLYAPGDAIQPATNYSLYFGVKVGLSTRPKYKYGLMLNSALQFKMNLDKCKPILQVRFPGAIHIVSKNIEIYQGVDVLAHIQTM